jgi:hypothetical protein
MRLVKPARQRTALEGTAQLLPVRGCNTSPNFGASVVRIIRLAEVHAVQIRGARQPGDLVAMLVHQREQQRKHPSIGGA